MHYRSVGKSTTIVAQRTHKDSGLFIASAPPQHVVRALTWLWRSHRAPKFPKRWDCHVSFFHWVNFSFEKKRLLSESTVRLLRTSPKEANEHTGFRSLWPKPSSKQIWWKIPRSLSDRVGSKPSLSYIFRLDGVGKLDICLVFPLGFRKRHTWARGKSRSTAPDIGPSRVRFLQKENWPRLTESLRLTAKCTMNPTATMGKSTENISRLLNVNMYLFVNVCICMYMYVHVCTYMFIMYMYVSANECM